MIKTLRESKARLSELVDLAAGGEEIIITVRGKPRARLCPIAQAPGGDREGRQLWEKRLREARTSYSSGSRDTGRELLDDLRGERS